MSDPAMERRLAECIQAGYAALAKGQWGEARRFFEATLAQADLPEAHEGLGIAAYWLEDVPSVFESRERAYQLYRQRGDRLGAARLATLLGVSYMLYRDAEAISNGWLQRAHRLLEGIEPAFEHGLLSGMEGFIALQFRNDVTAVRRWSADTLAVARDLDLPDLEILALSMEGLALVNEGQIDEGMRRLDEATTAALAGEVSNPDAIVTACCFLIDACKRVRDFNRAAQWCEKMQEFCERHAYTSMLAYCRTHHAAILTWRGAWDEAEAVLTTAIQVLRSTRAGLATRSILGLAELRRRQGRLEEASKLYAQIPGHPFATLGRAALALEVGDTLMAAELAERFLRQISPDDVVERIDGLVLAIRAHCSLGQLDQARTVLAALETAAARAGTPPLRAAVAEARGRVAASSDDLNTARREFEDAVDLFQWSGAPYETACARIELAHALAGLGRPEPAVTEARQALEVLRDLGAGQDAARAAALLDALGVSHSPARATRDLPAGLTRREAQVLGLLARGLSNHEIAAELCLSVRTVERHISTIYAKIDAEGSTARAVASMFAVTHGLGPASP